jgi:NADH-quinone oxidoreductase subunit L
MAIPLVVLAIGSILAGYLGVPHALGGSNRIETFLHPAFVASGGEAGAPGDAHAPASAAGEVHADASTELMLMGLSSGIAIAGIGIAWFLWARRPRGPAREATGLHRFLLNKYYVDELYDAAIVRPIHAISSGALWKGVDVGLIDGAVNGVGLGVSGASSILRRTQTGSVRTYAFAVLAGTVAILGYYLFR